MPKATIITFGARGRAGRQWLLDEFCISDVLDVIVYKANIHLNVADGKCHGDGTGDECKRILKTYPRIDEIIAVLTSNIANNWRQLGQLHFAYFVQCTAGISRSVALAQLLAEHLAAMGAGWEVYTVHLDSRSSYLLDHTIAGIGAVESMCEEEFENVLEIPVVNTIQRARGVLRELHGH